MAFESHFFSLQKKEYALLCGCSLSFWGGCSFSGSSILCLSKGSIMSVMNELGGPLVEMENQSKVMIRPITLKRSVAMLRTALYESGVESGVFRFLVFGPCDKFYHQGQPALEVTPFPTMANALFVRMKSCGDPDSAISGSLKLPEGRDHDGLLRELAIVLHNHSGKNGWKEVLDNVPPEPPPEKGLTEPSPISSVDPKGEGKMSSNLDMHQPLSAAALLPLQAEPVSAGASPSRDIAPSPPDVSGAQSLPTDDARASSRMIASFLAKDTSPPSTQASAHQDDFVKAKKGGTGKEHVYSEEQLTKFLLGVLKGSRDGLFQGKGNGPIAQEFFPERDPRGLVTSIAYKLMAMGWIHQAGSGTYRVDASFVKRHGLDIILVPSLPGNDAKGVVGATSTRSSKIAELAAELRVVTSLIEVVIEERRLLEDKVSSKFEALQRAQKEFDAAKVAFDEAQSDLVAFDQEKKILDPLAIAVCRSFQ